ncbi:YjhT family mutarotase [Vibrio mediterranei]
MTICLTALPPLPISMKNGIGGLLGRRLYTGLGSAGKRFYYLDIDNLDLGWQITQPFPGCERNDAASVTTDKGIYVFSGAGKMDTDPHVRVLTDSYFFSKDTQTWSKLDTTIPVGLLGASATSISDHQLIFIGGYCKETFDSLFAKISNASSATDERFILDSFMSQPIEAYGWNPHIWTFDTRTLRWSKLADNPYLPNCGAGLIVKDQQILLIEGEIKPGLRSLETKRFQIKANGSVECDLLHTIVQNEPKHEGIAGGFVGLIDNIPTVAGGAFFVGSQQRFQQGHLFSHQGLVKHHSNAIWQLSDSQWNKVGHLADGKAYGVSVSLDKGIAILGGENQQGQAVTDCFIISN